MGDGTHSPVAGLNPEFSDDTAKDARNQINHGNGKDNGNDPDDKVHKARQKLNHRIDDWAESCVQIYSRVVHFPIFCG